MFRSINALFLIWVTMVGFINLVFKFFRVIQDTVFVKDTI